MLRLDVTVKHFMRISGRDSSHRLEPQQTTRLTTAVQATHEP